MTVRPLIALCTLSMALTAAEVPRRSPEFVVKMPQGGQLLFSQYRGKVMCVEFLYTTCPHCQQASRLMSRLQSEYGPRGFQAIGVAFNEMSHMLVPDFVRDNKVNYPVGYSPREPIHDYLQIHRDYSMHVPQIVIIDRQGIIQQQSLRENDETTATEANLRRKIEELLKQPAAKGKAAVTRRKAS